MFSLATTWLPLIAPHIGEIEWANNQRSPKLPPSEEDRRSAEPTLWQEKTADQASNPRELAVDLAGEEEDRDPPVSIPSARSTNAAAALPRRKQGQHREEPWWRLPPRREPSGSEVYAVVTAHNADSQPLESRLCVLHSQAEHAQTVCIPAHDITWVGRNTQS